MADGYYNAPDDAPEPDKPDAAPSEEQDDSKGEGETTLVSNTVFPGGPGKPGDVCKFEIVHVYGDESEIRYVKEDGNKSGQARGAMHERMGKYADPMGGE